MMALFDITPIDLFLIYDEKIDKNASSENSKKLFPS